MGHSSATATAPEAAEARPLVVPLEGVLCRTDLGLEARVQALCANPLSAIRGAAPPPVSAAALPLDADLLAHAREARAAGRRVLLATTGDAAQAELITRETGAFDEVVAVPPGATVTDMLAERFGVAPEMADAGRRPVHRARAQIKAMRPHQWSKNALIFVPALAAHDPSGLGAACAAFVAFSLTASSVYVLNDIADLAADRAHPRKRNRPFAAGTLTIQQGLRLALGLILGALAVSLLFVSPAFLGMLALYYIATFAYSFWLKRKLVIDVIMLASLYTIRIIAGAAAAWVTLSPWMLGFSMFLFLALAAVKRQAELMDMVFAGDNARAGRGYVPDDLPVIRSMALAAGYAAVLVLALYISSEDVRVLYSLPEALWLLCPILLYWVSRMVMNTHRGKMNDDPIVYAATDKVSLGTFLAGAAIIFAASVL
ncbi:MAG: UbiA family prenyltransferase [Pseudomonadota bacterium]